MFSAYKTFGPHQGIMVVRKALAQRLPNQSHYFNANSLSKKITPAGPDHAQIAACAGMVDYVDHVYAQHFKEEARPVAKGRAVHDLAHAHEERILTPLMDYISARNDVRILGPRAATGRAPTIGLECDRSGEEIAAELARHGIMCGGGDFYAVRPLSAMGVPLDKGALRLSLVQYTTEQDVTKLITALDQVL